MLKNFVNIHLWQTNQGPRWPPHKDQLPVRVRETCGGRGHIRHQDLRLRSRAHTTLTLSVSQSALIREFTQSVEYLSVVVVRLGAKELPFLSYTCSLSSSSSSSLLRFIFDLTSYVYSVIELMVLYNFNPKGRVLWQNIWKIYKWDIQRCVRSKCEGLEVNHEI